MLFCQEVFRAGSSRVFFHKSDKLQDGNWLHALINTSIISPMILYHGTSTKYLHEILENGILPREVSGNEGNWTGSVESKLNFVYLTSAYPVYFSQIAASNTNSDLAILQIDVDENELYPDEDFIARVFWNQHGRQGELKDLNRYFDPSDYQQIYRACLEHNGTACINTIEPQAILSHVVLEAQNIGLIMEIGGDAMPIPLNYKVYGDHYTKCIEVLFDKGEAAAWEVSRQKFADFNEVN